MHRALTTYEYGLTAVQWLDREQYDPTRYAKNIRDLAAELIREMHEHGRRLPGADAARLAESVLTGANTAQERRELLATLLNDPRFQETER